MRHPFTRANRVLAALVCLLCAGAPRAQEANPRAFATDRPERPADPDGPILLFQDGPIDLEALRQRLARPDFVVLPGSQFEALRAQSSVAAAPPVLIEAIEVKGSVARGVASLALGYRVVVSTPGRSEVDLGLKGQVITDARDGERRLPLRLGERGTWLVEVEGAGRRSIQVELPVPIQEEADLDRLELGIPEAASTRVELDLDGQASEAWAALDEPLALEALGAGRSRIRASVSPRDVLALSWRPREEPTANTQPVLNAQGEIALSVDRGTLSTRSSWSIRCERGLVQELEVQLAESREELIALELDDQPVTLTGLGRSGEGWLRVPLPAPLRPGDATRRLTLTTRLALPAGATTRQTIGGYPIRNALAQSGVIGVVQGEDLWVSGTVGRGVRAINPLVGLPESLRNRPRTVLAFQFVGQPFDLELRVDPSPPTLQVETRTTLQVDAGQVRQDAHLDYRVLRGKVRELEVLVPDGLEITSVGPESLVVDYQVLAEPEGTGSDAGSRRLQIRLAPAAQSETAFSVGVQARQVTEEVQAIAAGLVEPRAAAQRGGVLAVVPGREMAVDLAETNATGAGRPSGFQRLGPEAPVSAWTWPGEPPAPGSVLWLRYDGSPRAVDLQVSVRNRSLSHQSRATIQVERRRLDLSQVVVCSVRDGTLRTVEVEVPAMLERLPGGWGVEGAGVAERTLLARAPDGSARYALSLARDVIDSVELRFWGRLPVEPELDHDRATRLAIPVLLVRTGAAAAYQVEVSADPGIDLSPDGEGWIEETNPGPAGGLDGRLPPRWRWTGPAEAAGGLACEASAPLPAELPRLLASRHWVRSVRDPGGGYQVEAWYRVETHPGSLVLRLPRGARPIQARVAGDAITPERAGVDTDFRIRIPAELQGPLLVGLSYSLAASAEPAGGILPRLSDGGVVLDTLWELRVPWNEAVVGVPPGWTDANRWYWSGYVWKRRPNLDPRELTTWVAGTNVRGRPARPREDDARTGYHGYLFGRPGDSVPVVPPVYARAAIVGVCSGIVLALGVLLLLVRPPARVLFAALAASVLALAAGFDPSVTVLLVQSAAIGLVLTLLAALTQWLVDRRRPPARALPERGSGMARVGAPGGDSGFGPAADPGADASTVIRRRPPSATTVDFRPAQEVRPQREGQPHG